MTDSPAGDGDTAPIVLPLLVEEATVTKRRRVRRRVRVGTVTHERPQVLREVLTREEVVVERVPVATWVDAIPPVRTEGDVTILPVVEERLVVERRLFLVEEVRIRTIRTTHEWNDTVTVLYQDIFVHDHDSGEPRESDGVGGVPLTEENTHG